MCATRQIIRLFIAALPVLLPWGARAHTILYDTILPTGAVIVGDDVSLEVVIGTPHSPPFLIQPTDVTVEGNQITVDMYVDSGPQTAIGCMREIVPLGVFASGTYTYTVQLHPNDNPFVPHVVEGAFDVVVQEDPDPRADSLRLFWWDHHLGGVWTSRSDGAGAYLIDVGQADCQGDVAVDPVNEWVYWTDECADVIRRARPNGAQPETVVELGAGFDIWIAVDPNGRKLYWTRWGGTSIYRANLDGTGAEEFLATGSVRLYGVTVDPPSGKVYWAARDEPSERRIYRANFDGSGVEIVLTTSANYEPLHVAVDSSGGKVYWSSSDRRIVRANLDGSQSETVLYVYAGDVGRPALDLQAGKLYWSLYIQGCYVLEGRLMRADLDGSNVETLLVGLGAPMGLALAPPMSIPATSTWGLVVFAMLLLAVGTVAQWPRRRRVPPDGIAA